MTAKSQDDLPLAVVGCDFRVAPSAVRSRLVATSEERQRLFEQLAHAADVDGLVDLNTCNRNEWIASGTQPAWAAELMRAAMLERAGEECRGWLRPYVFLGRAAARHVFRVATGQESLVVGERQVSGQLYRALEAARRLGTSSRTLNGLGSIAGRLVRIGMRRGCVQNSAVGVHSLAVSYLVSRGFSSPASRVAIVGLGRIGRRVAVALRESLGMTPLLCNRTTAGWGQGVHPLGDLGRLLEEAEAAVVCTGALAPVVRPEHLPDKALLLLDIGIPQQVERRGLPARVEVVGLDQLTDFYRSRRPVLSAPLAAEAEKLVERALDEFSAFCRETGYSAVLEALQRQQRQLLEEELQRLFEDRFAQLPVQLRERLREEMRGLLLSFSSETIRTVCEAFAAECVSGQGLPGGAQEPQSP